MQLEITIELTLRRFSLSPIMKLTMRISIWFDITHSVLLNTVYHYSFKLRTGEDRAITNSQGLRNVDGSFYYC